MRWFPRLLVAFTALVPLATACGGADGGASEDRLSVVATIAPTGALVAAVAGDDAEVRVLVGAGVDPHDYELKAADRKAIERAGLIFRNGLGVDEFLDKAIRDSGADIIVLSEGLDLRKAGDAQGEPDPHVWHDIDNDRAMVKTIAEALSKADPAHADGYRQRAAAYDQRLAAVDTEIRAIIESIPAANRKVVTNHDAIGYFLDRYGLKFVGAVIPGRSSQAEPSSKEIAALVDLIRREGVKAIFADSSVDPKVARQIANDTGARIIDDVYGDSLGPKGSGAETVDGMLLSNARKIAEGLK